MACPSAYAQDKAKILIVNSYHADSPWVKAHNSILISELSDKVLLSFAYLDSKRLSRKETEATINHAWKMFKEIKPDLVILADDYALERLGRRILNTLTPVIFLGINNNPRQYIGNMAQITGVLERPLLKRSISYIQEIIGGNMNKCLVLFDNSMTAQTTFQHIFKGNYSQVFNWTEVNIQMVSTWYLWRETVLNAKRNGYMPLFWAFTTPSVTKTMSISMKKILLDGPRKMPRSRCSPSGISQWDTTRLLVV